MEEERQPTQPEAQPPPPGFAVGERIPGTLPTRKSWWWPEGRARRRGLAVAAKAVLFVVPMALIVYASGFAINAESEAQKRENEAFFAYLPLFPLWVEKVDFAAMFLPALAWEFVHEPDTRTARLDDFASMTLELADLKAELDEAAVPRQATTAHPHLVKALVFLSEGIGKVASCLREDPREECVTLASSVRKETERLLDVFTRALGAQ